MEILSKWHFKRLILKARIRIRKLIKLNLTEM